jgi:hypothetical protein
MADRTKNVRPQPDADPAVEDARLAKFFKNPRFGYLHDPGTVLDQHGRIMLWHLPSIYSPQRMVSCSNVLKFYMSHIGTTGRSECWHSRFTDPIGCYAPGSFF